MTSQKSEGSLGKKLRISSCSCVPNFRQPLTAKDFIATLKAGIIYEPPQNVWVCVNMAIISWLMPQFCHTPWTEAESLDFAHFPKCLISNSMLWCSEAILQKTCLCSIIYGPNCIWGFSTITTTATLYVSLTLTQIWHNLVISELVKLNLPVPENGPQLSS